MLWYVEQLPDDAATVAALRGGPDHRSWQVTETLLAGVVNRLGELIVVTAQPNTKKRLAAPDPVMPPGAKQGRRRGARVVSLAQLPE